METSAPFLFVSTKRSAGWPSGVFPKDFLVVEPDCDFAPAGDRVVISNAPEKIVTAIQHFIRVPRTIVFRLQHGIASIILLAGAHFRSMNYSFAGCRGASFSMAGNGAEAVKECSGTAVPERSAFAIKVMASPVLGGTITVAANCPVRTHAWPVLGTPSQPMMGMPSHWSRSGSGIVSSIALRAPMPIASFCATIRSIRNRWAAIKRSHEQTLW